MTGVLADLDRLIAAASPQEWRLSLDVRWIWDAGEGSDIRPVLVPHHDSGLSAEQERANAALTVHAVNHLRPLVAATLAERKFHDHMAGHGCGYWSCTEAGRLKNHADGLRTEALAALQRDMAKLKEGAADAGAAQED